MRRRHNEVNPVEELAARIAQYHEEQDALGVDRPILSPDLQEAYDGLTGDEIRRELARLALQPVSRTQGETHIWRLLKQEVGN